MERPALDVNMSTDELRSYYYLKEELMRFCSELGLSRHGSKGELIERLSAYLDSGSIEPPRRNVRTKITKIDLNDRIEENITFSEIHREFFRRTIHPGFKFNVRFCKWLRENPGRTYSDAIAAYPESLIKTGEIGKQFKYNTYIRDFFADNPEMGLNDAIVCWNHKKMTSVQCYERSDLSYLEQH